MRFQQADLITALQRANVGEEEARTVVSFLVAKSTDATYRLSVPSLLWYFGTAMLVLSFTLFSEPLLKRHPNIAAFWLAMAGIAILVLLLYGTRAKTGLDLLRGILCLGIVLLSCVATLGLQFPERIPETHFGDNPYPVCLTAIVVAALANWRTKFIPLVVPIAVSVWVLCWRISMDMHLYDFVGGEDRLRVCIGLVLLLALWPLDCWSEANYGFWIHKIVVAILAIDVGLFLHATHDGLAKASPDEATRALGVAVCLVVAGWSIFLRRPSGIFSAMVGVFVYIQHVVTYVADDFRPVPVAVVGVVAVLVGRYFHTREWAFFNRLRPRERIDPVIYEASGEPFLGAHE